MFDYETLIDQVRRMIGDDKIFTFEENVSQNTSYYLSLSNEGAISINENGLIINDEIISESSYSLNGNILKFNELIEVGSSIVVEYEYSQYSDEKILLCIGDTINSYISGLTNVNYMFGENGYSETQTGYNITNNEMSLFVHGTVLTLVGINLLEVAGDAIYIKDGETTIRTDVSSKEAGTTYLSIMKRFLHLLKTVQANTFQGEVNYD